MRILLLFHLLPYPPNDGGRIGFFNPIKYLSRNHELSVISLTDGRERDDSISQVAKYCARFRTYRCQSLRETFRLVKGALASPPGSAAKYWDPGVAKLLRTVIEAERPDVIEFHHLNMAGYRRFAGRMPCIFREHNVEYKVWERYAKTASTWRARRYAAWTAPRVRRYEARVASTYDRCIVVSPADARYLREAAPHARIECIPSGVDTDFFRPVSDVEDPCTITITGSFAWKPKQESLSILLTRIFPSIRSKIPGVKLKVVGKGVPKHLEELGRQTLGVEIVGEVPDVRPYVVRATLLINYLESGGGIALKVLEAMAMRKPVLSNSLGCEGIPVKHGRDIFVADSAEKFAEAAVYLLNSPPLRQRIAEEGYRRVLETYSWEVVAQQLQRCYGEVLKERGLGPLGQHVGA